MTLKKLAIFVEGQTEQIFLKEFIEQIAGQGNINFTCQTANAAIRLSQNVPIERETHQVLIYDCRGDEAVKSVVLEQRASLSLAGYSLILGVRDLYPRGLSELESIKKKLQYGVPTSGVPTHILIAVAEIEAWFLQEHSHFSKIDLALDVAMFKEKFNFDPNVDSAETVAAPAALLHKIYATVGKAYKKTRKNVQRTVEVLDYGNLYLSCGEKMPHLQVFVNHIENFLAPDLG